MVHPDVQGLGIGSFLLGFVKNTFVKDMFATGVVQEKHVPTGGRLPIALLPVYRPLYVQAYEKPQLDLKANAKFYQKNGFCRLNQKLLAKEIVDEIDDPYIGEPDDPDTMLYWNKDVSSNFSNYFDFSSITNALGHVIYVAKNTMKHVGAPRLPNINTSYNWSCYSPVQQMKWMPRERVLAIPWQYKAPIETPIGLNDFNDACQHKEMEDSWIQSISNDPEGHLPTVFSMFS
jgi:hypothetical protein